MSLADWLLKLVDKPQVSCTYELPTAKQYVHRYLKTSKHLKTTKTSEFQQVNLAFENNFKDKN